MATIHATTVAWHGNGIVIRGEPGSGKSDLGLRLIDGGAVLVSDDYTEVRAKAGALIARAPDTIAGKMEVRGLGVADLACVGDMPVALVVSLVAREAVERVPDPADTEIEGVVLPEIMLCGFDASAPAKVRLAVRQLGRGAGA